MPISYPRLILYGFLTYAATFMLWALLAAYGLSAGWGAQVTSYIVTAAVVFFAARMLKLGSFKAALLCGAIWAVMHVALDLIYVVPAAGFLALLTPYPWTAYAIVLIAPLAAVLHTHKEISIGQTLAR